METVIPVENGDVLAAMRRFLQQMLESGVVESLFVPLEVGGGMVSPAFVTAPSRLAQANPLLPLMPINSARAVSALTDKRTPSKIGAVLRPCELRALIELVKLQQANLENVILISFDCLGTYELRDYQANQIGATFKLPEFLKAASLGEMPVASIAGSPSLRLACQMCIQPLPIQADLYLHFIGVDTSQGIPVTFKEDEKGAVWVEQLQLEQTNRLNGAEQQAVERLISARREVHQRELTAVRSRMISDGGIASLFTACIRCHNCMTVCPICYCKTCLFRSTAFNRPPEAYLKAAFRKGAQRMLGDTLLFHMTRLNHMSASCVSCGMCSSACPADIPVGVIFSAIGEQVQAVFGYQPGRDVREPLPLVTYQADEWVEIGEER